MIVSIMGFMASGKSSVGRLLADICSYNYIDLDLYIEGQEGETTSYIFGQYGEEHFRDLEHKYLAELVNTHKNLILPLGGGTPCFERNWKSINQTTSIYLRKSNEALFQRLLTRKAKRPLIADLSDEELKQLIDAKLTHRAPYYERSTHIIRAEQSKKQTARQIAEVLNLTSPH